jgi:hypothetical protein
MSSTSARLRSSRKKRMVSGCTGAMTAQQDRQRENREQKTAAVRHERPIVQSRS